MSLWRPETVEVAVGHRLAAGVNARTSAGRVEALLIEFEQALDARAAQRGAHVRCVIGGEAARYAVVPWHDELSSPADRLRLARQCLRETYGDVATGWAVCVHGERHGAGALACAIDQTLIDGLDAAAEARGLRVVSIQPSLAHAFNRLRRGIPNELCWFVLEETHSAVLLLSTPSEPLLVKRLSVAGPALAGALDREWFALGIDAGRCPVVVPRAPDAPATPSANLPGWRVIEAA